MIDRHTLEDQGDPSGNLCNLGLAMVDLASPLALRVAAEVKKAGVMRDLRDIAIDLCGSHEADARCRRRARRADFGRRAASRACEPRHQG